MREHQRVGAHPAVTVDGLLAAHTSLYVVTVSFDVFAQVVASRPHGGSSRDAGTPRDQALLHTATTVKLGSRPVLATVCASGACMRLRAHADVACMCVSWPQLRDEKPLRKADTPMQTPRNTISGAAAIMLATVRWSSSTAS
eukprot:6174521-Pleurochrysis_carterae.AAC.7